MPTRNLTLLMSRIPPKLMLMLMSLLALKAGFVYHSQQEKHANELRALQEAADKKPTANIVVAAQAIPETKPQEPQGFEAKIKAGYRAIAIPVDPNTGVAGFINPESRVDILLQSGSGAEASTVPILSDVQVVAVGCSYAKTQTGEALPTSNVTVAVPPRDGEKLISAMAQGKLYCLLRAQNDRAPLALKDISNQFKKTVQNPETQSSLSVLPALQDAPKMVLPETSPVAEPPRSRLHNVDSWSASRHEEITLPAGR